MKISFEWKSYENILNILNKLWINILNALSEKQNWMKSIRK